MSEHLTNFEPGSPADVACGEGQRNLARIIEQTWTTRLGMPRSHVYWTTETGTLGNVPFNTFSYAAMFPIEGDFLLSDLKIRISELSDMVMRRLATEASAQQATVDTHYLVYRRIPYCTLISRQCEVSVRYAFVRKEDFDRADQRAEELLAQAKQHHGENVVVYT